MKQIIKDEGIWVETTPPDTPELNGTAERVNRTLATKVHVTLLWPPT